MDQDRWREEIPQGGADRRSAGRQRVTGTNRRLRCHARDRSDEVRQALRVSGRSERKRSPRLATKRSSDVGADRAADDLRDPPRRAGEHRTISRESVLCSCAQEHRTPETRHARCAPTGSGRSRDCECRTNPVVAGQLTMSLVNTLLRSYVMNMCSDQGTGPPTSDPSCLNTSLAGTPDSRTSESLGLTAATSEATGPW